jgi:hypothetical protein
MRLSARLPLVLEPRHNLPARQPALAEAHIARTAKPALDLPVSAQALQGMLYAQMTPVTVAGLIRSASQAASKTARSSRQRMALKV